MMKVFTGIGVAILLLVTFALGFVAVMVLTSGCGVQPGPPVPPEAGTADDCPAACENMERLQCAGWEGSPGVDEEFGTADDISCVTVCVSLSKADETMTLFPLCTSKAETCADIELCFEGGLK